jgi:AbrB family looped-hinge helix DNA binding protein
MNMQTRISSKGQIVIPKAVRSAMKLPVGAEFVVIQQHDDILLRRERRKEGLSIDEAAAQLKIISAPFRPKIPFSIEEISSVSEEALREHYAKHPE